MPKRVLEKMKQITGAVPEYVRVEYVTEADRLGISVAKLAGQQLQKWADSRVRKRNLDKPPSSPQKS